MRYLIATLALAGALFLWPEPMAAQPIACPDHGACGPTTAVVADVQQGRPAGCPTRWCGCWLGRRLGMTDRRLWVAREWARVGRPLAAPRPGAIVVWRHHVGLVIAVPGPGRIIVRSGNDGRRVRTREHSTAGVIAYRAIDMWGS